MELYLLGDDGMNHEDGFESSVSTNVPPNTFNTGHLSSPDVEAILSILLDPSEPTTSYNYIEEVEDRTVNPLGTGEVPVTHSGPFQPFEIPGETQQLTDILPLVPADTTQPGVETRLVKRQRYDHVILSELTTIRTRREEKPRTHGPNRFGRAGCKRCELCRKHRQKVLLDGGD